MFRPYAQRVDCVDGPYSVSHPRRVSARHLRDKRARRRVIKYHAVPSTIRASGSAPSSSSITIIMIISASPIRIVATEARVCMRSFAILIDVIVYSQCNIEHTERLYV